MKARLTFTLIIAFVIINLNATKYAGEIFRVGAGVRNYALGHNGLTDLKTKTPAYWNAALLSQIKRNNIDFMHAEEFDGLMQNDVISLTLQNKFALTLARIAIDDVALTKLENESDSLYFANRPYIYDYSNNADYIVHFGFRQSILGFDLGITPKVVYRSLADDSGFGFGADFSFYKSFAPYYALGMNMRDLFTSQIMWENGTNEVVYPSFDLENKFTFNLPFFKFPTNLFLAGEIYTESRDYASDMSMGFISIDAKYGLEIDVNRHLDFLAGYYNENPTAGFSLNISRWNVDYAFEMNDELDNSHRVSLGMNF